MTSDENSPADIAVIGMACRFPGASNPQQYWLNLREGVESIRWYSDDELRARGVPDELITNPHYVKASGAFDEGEGFDAAFFGYSVREAEIMDPQHRHFLEVSYHALEDAGYDPARYDGLIGVYGGSTMNTYLPMNVIAAAGIVDVVGDLQVMIGSDKEYLPARVSYKLNLTGPSIAVQSACSTSLTAIHSACQAILAGECDMALAGGSSVRMPFFTGYLHNPAGTSSPDGHCRAFDAGSGGSVVGNGAGVVVLKHLADALTDGDHVYAVIKGTAITNDGSGKVSFTAPSVQGQARAIAGALLASQLSADDIGYVEAHGTGTPLGDPIEVAALTQAYREHTRRTQFCVLGSVKTNIGHLDAAAGVSGFIKTVQILRHQLIPPTLHFKSPNPQLNLEESPFWVNNELLDWESDTLRRAAVNSLGMGGSNAHVILEEAPPQTPGDPAKPGQLLVLSAHTQAALDTSSANLAAWLRANPAANLADIAYTLQVGRRPLHYRRVVAVKDIEDACFALETPGSARVLTKSCDPPAVGAAFLFPGQGGQFPGMAASLYGSFPAYQIAFNECVELFQLYLPADLHLLLVDSGRDDQVAAEQLSRTEVTQPAVFTAEYSLAILLRELGLAPTAMLGHSVGEYVAAVLAGVMTLPDAVRLVAARGRLIGALAPGAMISATISEAAVQAYLVPGVDIAAVNTQELVTLSGEPTTVAEVRARLESDRIVTRSLQVSHAFHSALIDPVLAEFSHELETVDLRVPSTPFVSSLTGGWMTGAESTSAEYWVRHLRETVRFADACTTLAAEKSLILVEVGAGSSLLSMAQSNNASAWSSQLSVQPGHRDRSDGRRVFLRGIGAAWASGLRVDWSGLWTGTTRRRVSLPTYPFEHRRYWIDPVPQRSAAPSGAAIAPPTHPAAAAEPATESDLHRRPDLNTLFVSPRTEIEGFIAAAMSELIGIQQIGVDDNFFELDANSLMAVQLVARIRERYDIDLPMAKLFEQPTVSALARFVADSPRPDVPDAQPSVEPDNSAESELAELLRDHSEDEIARILDEIELPDK